MQEPIHASPSSDSDFGSLRQLIGEKAARKIMTALGGTCLYVPSPDALHADHKLVRCVGLECARTICERFHRSDIDVPLGFEAAYFKTRDGVRRLHALGVTSPNIALELGIHVLTVRRWLRRLGLKGNRPPHVTNFAKRDQIKALHDEGMDIATIVEELEIPRKTVRKWVKVFGLTTSAPASDHPEDTSQAHETAPGRVPPTSA